MEWWDKIILVVVVLDFIGTGLIFGFLLEVYREKTNKKEVNVTKFDYLCK